MKMIISPAKKMNVDLDGLPPTALPQFLGESEEILTALREMEDGALQALWRCNDSIAKVNVARVREMELEKNLTPAILAYEGIQYRYMAPSVFEAEQLQYIQDHLRILSGFYGVLRPFDGVTPYRLELQAKLAVGGHRDLYGFWGDKIAQSLWGEGDCILNLASKEYSRVVERHMAPGGTLVTVTFGERKGDKILEKGTMCKMARGQMVRWMAERQVEKPEQLKEFSDLGYGYWEKESTPNHLIFLK